MKTKTRTMRSLAGASALCVSVLSVVALEGRGQTFTLTSPTGSSTAAIGQSFSPSVEPMPDPGLGAGATVYLQDFTFTAGGEGLDAGTQADFGDAETYLAIMPGAYFAYDVSAVQRPDPDFTFEMTTAASNAVGLSTNTIDTQTATQFEPITWQFDNLALDYETTYSATFVTLSPDGLTLTPIRTAVTFVEYAETEPGSGVFEAIANIGGVDNFDINALFGDFDGTGFSSGTPLGEDLGFGATFTTTPVSALAGDYNASGQVEQGDLDLVLQNWGLDTDANGPPAGWLADLPSGQIEQSELDGVLQNWGATAVPGFSGSAVPEPGAAAVGLLGCGWIALRRVRS